MNPVDAFAPSEEHDCSDIDSMSGSAKTIGESMDMAVRSNVGVAIMLRRMTSRLLVDKSYRQADWKSLATDSTTDDND